MSVNSNDPRQQRLRHPSRLQAIAEPTEDNLVEVVLALKEAVETLSQERGNKATHAVTFQDLKDLGIVELMPNDAVESKLPFGRPAETSQGMLKWCDGVDEDFGQGEGWYYKGSNNVWRYLSNIAA